MGSHQAYLSRPMLLWVFGVHLWLDSFLCWTYIIQFWPNQLLRPSIILPRTGQSYEIPWLALSLCSIDPLWYPGKFVWFLCWIMWLFCNYVFFMSLLGFACVTLLGTSVVYQESFCHCHCSNFFRFPALPSSFWSLSHYQSDGSVNYLEAEFTFLQFGTKLLSYAEEEKRRCL